MARLRSSPALRCFGSAQPPGNALAIASLRLRRNGAVRSSCAFCAHSFHCSDARLFDSRSMINLRPLLFLSRA